MIKKKNRIGFRIEVYTLINNLCLDDQVVRTQELIAPTQNKNIIQKNELPINQSTFWRDHLKGT